MNPPCGLLPQERRSFGGNNMEVIVENIKPNMWTFDAEEDDPVHVIVRGVEADVNAQGWDNHARLAVVLKKDFTDRNGTYAYAVCEVPMFSEFYANPGQGLAVWTSQMLQNMDVLDHLFEMMQPFKDNFCGWIFVSETWSIRGEVGDFDENTPDPVDHPDRFEARICLLCMTDGRVVQLTRTRNKDGRLDHIEIMDSKDDVQAGGQVVWNMLVLLTLSNQMVKLQHGTTGIF